jgi:HEPN domain-containing protein
MSLEKYQHDARRWLQQAQADLGAARNSLAAGNHEWAAFQSQQAGEKALKSLWLSQQSRPEGKTCE